MALTPKFVDPLRIEQIGSNGRTTWRLTDRLRYDSAVLGCRLVIPAGFVTDLASVPRWPLVWLIAGAEANRPAVVHDFLYVIQWPSKDVADRTFLEAMRVDNDPASDVKRRLMYRFVHWFGKGSWDSDDVESRLSLNLHLPGDRS